NPSGARRAALRSWCPLSLVAPRRQLDVLEMQRLLVADRRLVVALVLPHRDVGELLVVAEGLAVGGLVLLAEVAAAGLLARERVADHEFGELEEVGHTARALEGDV